MDKYVDVEKVKSLKGTRGITGALIQYPYQSVWLLLLAYHTAVCASYNGSRTGRTHPADGPAS